MKYILQNKKGLFLQAGGDYSFTKEKKDALTFYNEEEAQKKAMVLMKYGVKVIQIEVFL